MLNRKSRGRTRRYDVPMMTESLDDTIRKVRSQRHNTIAYRRARDEARKLMGIPDLHTKRFVKKYRNQIKRILSIVDGVADYLYESAFNMNGSWAYGSKQKIDEVNSKIRSANQYRAQNPMLLINIPELSEIDINALELIPSFILLGLDLKATNTHEQPTTMYNKKEMTLSGLVIQSRSGVPMIVGCTKCGLDMEGHLV